MRKISLRLAAALLVISLFMADGCTRPDKSPQINLREIKPVIQKHGTEQNSPLKVALASITSPKESMIYYGDLLQYLESHLGRPVKVVQRKTYKEVNDLIEAGGTDLFPRLTRLMIR